MAENQDRSREERGERERKRGREGGR